MPIRVSCSGCKTVLAVKDHLAGKRVKCPKCQTALAIPNPAAGAPMSVAKPPVAKKPSVPVAKPADLETLAAATLQGETQPATPSPGPTNGNGHVDHPPIKFNCTYCDFEIDAPFEQAGKMMPCPDCTRIIKVPLPKVEKPKDWRTVEKKGPSAALVNQVEKIENAWGTETKSKVSQTALLEAGVIKKVKPPGIGVAGWIERGVKAAFLFVVVGGLSFGIYTLYKNRPTPALDEQEKKLCNANWPPAIQAHYMALLAKKTLRRDKSAEASRVLFIEAWQKTPPPNDPKDKIDRDFALIEIAKLQTALGGDEMQIRGKDRFDWNQEVFDEIVRTIKKIESPECRAVAIRELVAQLAALKKADLGGSLASSASEGAAPGKAVMISLDVAKAGKAPTAKETAKDPVLRCGAAEGIVRMGSPLDDALAIAKVPGDTAVKVQALVAIASALAHDPSFDRSPDVRKVCAETSALLEKDAKANIPPWVLLQHIRLLARGDAEQAKALSNKLPVAFRRRAQVEIALALLNANPPPENGPQIIAELDKEGAGRALAWFTFARAKANANLSFTFAPEDPSDEIYRPYIEFADTPAIDPAR